MNSSLMKRSCLCTLALLLFAALPAQAQIGGIGRRAMGAAEKALKGEEKQEKVVYNEHVLEMTPEVVDRLGKALAAEDAKRREILRLAAAVRTPEAHEQCTMEVVMSPEGQSAMEEMNAKAMARVEKPGDRAAMDAHLKAQEAYMKLVRDRCGPDPDEFESERRDMQSRLPKMGEEAGGFTPTQYAVLKERITPLCAIAQTAGDGEVRIPGDGRNIFWVYSAVEVETIVPRCAELSGLIAAAK
ncbi:MAG TPA: hypothetical protein VHG09_00520 [Longimicrobiales bacterium]|nr:hypothetical protein [Longimicrobiales bacterium]